MIQPPSLAPPVRVYDLVVVGSSAGGIEALSTLVATLPPDFAVPVVIAQHLAPDHLSHLGEILARRTVLPVHTVVDEEPLLPGGIYVVPADRDVEITDGHVRLRSAHGKRPTPSVNRLFSSAARAHGERLIGVILTGSGSDGAAGARDVKASGGMVVIENPATAAYPSMPQSLAPSTVDLTVDLDQIGPLLAKVIAGMYTPAPTEAADALPRLLAQVRDHSGIDFASYKPPTILRRLQRRLAATRTTTLVAYLAYLGEHPEEYALLVASFLINVTEFFRDADLFDALRTQVLPNLLAQAQQTGGDVRCWSAGCATGEEAYSLAILFVALLGDAVEQLPIRIFATDVDADAIAYARRGIYPANALTRVPPDLLARCFTPRDGAYEITPAVRQLIVFGQHDLAQRAPFPHLDLVMCRNVLIYFTPELQQRALHLFAFALRTGGYLALGKAETTQALAAPFVAVLAPLKLYQRQGAQVLVPPTVLQRPPLPPLLRASARIPVAPPTLVPRPPSQNERVGTLLMHSPSGVVVVDRRYDIQAMNRVAQEVLGIFRPALGEDLLHLLTSVPAAPVRALIDAAFQQPTPVLELLVATVQADQRYLQFTAAATLAAAGAEPQVLVQISDVTMRVKATEVAATQRHQQQVAAAAPASPLSDQQQEWASERRQLRAENARQAAQIEQVLASNGTLLAANQELAQANLALTGLHEDVVVRNEELQTATEEIKTLNEEMQATNEELETLNEEQEATLEELRATNDDLLVRSDDVQALAAEREEQRQISEAKAAELGAILRSIGDAVLVLAPNGEVVFTNAAYETHFGVTGMAGAADEHGVALPPAALPQQVAAGGQPFRMTFTVPTAEGERRYYEAAGAPIGDGVAHQGSVITLRDITDGNLRRLQEEFFALASHELRGPLTSITMAAQMLERRLGSADAQGNELLATILRQIRRQQHLIDDLMDISRFQHGKLRLTLGPVDLRELVPQIITTFALGVPQPPIVLDAPSGSPLTIGGDAVRLEQILTNLLTNASKYAANSPQIVVRVAQVVQDAEIQVEDQGPGIAAADLPHLFQRFYQVQADAATALSGLGLGLFLTRELVVAHGGQIAVASQVGQGTTFTLRFPLLPPTAH